MNEDNLQAQCYQWAWNAYPTTRRCLWAVPNGGWRNKIEAMKLKATGVVAGVHDMHFYWCGKFYTFELKVGKNKLSTAQKEWRHIVECQGATCYEIYDLATFQQIFSNLVAL